MLREYIRGFLTERRRQEQAIMYHGTSDVNLRSVFKHGIEPKPTNKTWGKDPGSSIIGSRVSLEGSYWTRNIMTALSSARNAVERQFGGNEIVIGALISPGSVVADEDSVKFRILERTEDWLRKQGYHSAWGPHPAWHGMWDAISESQKNKLSTDYANFMHKELTKNPQMPIDVPMWRRVLETGINRRNAYAELDWNYKRDYGRAYVENLEQKSSTDEEWQKKEIEAIENIKFPEEQQSEAVHLQALDVIARRYVESAREVEEPGHTARTLGPVGFSGRNRIIFIVKCGEQTITLLYGKMSDDFLSQWVERIGPDFEFIDATLEQE